jgi:hypothetical protein
MSGEDDNRWRRLLGGYRVPYDPRPALAKLRSGDAAAWAELWNELHHQGHVDTASYAAVPELVAIYRARPVPDWNVYGLVGTIELQRGVDENSDLPSWLVTPYHAALSELAECAIADLKNTADPLVSRSALAIIAVVKNLRSHARVMLELDESEIAEVLDEGLRRGA